MPGNTYDYGEIKTKIRSLKKLEIKIRFPDSYASGSGKVTRNLVWDEFFDLGKEYKGKAKYSLNRLASMSKEGIREVIDEYFFHSITGTIKKTE